VRRIYLDHNATTPLDPAVAEAMRPHLEGPGNPSSPHAEGRAARVALDEARVRLARGFGAIPEEVVFTSGGTEANNLGILGAARASQARGRHVLATRLEHASVLEPLGRLAKEGFEVEFLPVTGEGRLDPSALAGRLRPDTVLVVLQAANNETGAIQPIDEVAACLPPAVAFLCDATQAIGKIPLPAGLARANLVSISGHKVHGPRGAGALVVRRGARIEPIAFGGGQERGLRPGTENVASLVGLAVAVERAVARVGEYGERVGALAERLLERIERGVPGARLHGPRLARLPNTLNVALPCFDGRALPIALDLAGLAASAGSACESGAVEPSHVLLAMGAPEEEASRSVRFSLGWGLTEDDVDEASRRILEVVVRLAGDPLS
jgi:cysteine desulfurase